LEAIVLTAEQRAAFLDLVERQFGIRGSDYGAGRMDEAVSTVLPTTTCTTPDELLVSLETDDQPRWLHALVEHLTVGETYFLRDPAQIAALRETILPDLIQRRAGEQRLRLWSAGCSTGEEPYTLAILLRENFYIHAAWDVLLVGTDVNRESLRIAREGNYPAWSFRATPDEIRSRYFLASDTGWRLTDSIRRMTRFAWMNLGADSLMPPSADLDLIMCRNVTIYFDEAATQRLYRALVRALAPGGWLMLGPSDPVPADRGGLERVEVEGAVLWRRVKVAARSTRGLETTRVQGSTRVGGAAVKRAEMAEPRGIAVAKASPVTLDESEEMVADGSGAEAAKWVATPGLRTIAAATAGAIPMPAAELETVVADGRAELDAGLLALEAGALAAALDWLRRATFRDPRSPLAQFALGRAYADNGDASRAHTALIQARRLLAPLDGEALVPGSDAMPVESLRQTIRTHLEGLHA
jgi:chemotaxis protein methyltransferase CheR